MEITHTWPNVLDQLLGAEELSMAQAAWAMNEIITGNASDAQIGGFLTLLAAKGVSVNEIVGFRDAILDTAMPVGLEPDCVDIVGTGGDRFGTFNVSTTASIITAATGVPVVKHGNRAVSSKSGASDVLTELGVDLDYQSDNITEVFDETNISFVWAAKFLSGFRHVATARADLGIPTVFNFLGPLCNPVRPEANAVGVADIRQAPLLAGVFQFRGASALVFRGDDGLDELSTTGHSHIWEVSRGSITEHDIDPRDVGLPVAKIADLVGGTPAENAVTIRRILEGEHGPARDIALLNAAAGMVAYDLYKDPATAELGMHQRLQSKIEIAAEAVDSGKALDQLARWSKATHPAGA
ncbi:anthranilate phosphoribosyltransferase [Leucobacter sp. UCMA 4100]|uniref:anthranilate phosphoribosyltransferase n=1 Tax=Leucobacter sp. UCMA 4100 TaxID=2810534 RepID=UPI0022EA4AEC|nr:anthranilate phosphoribosyltransferase [Leucobacter sp. UCMA 4100]MDA3145830.1 anthranilate phosphoribosyltransferase [Leucobacter sp. UCMA 4100]